MQWFDAKLTVTVLRLAVWQLHVLRCTLVIFDVTEEDKAPIVMYEVIESGTRNEVRNAMKVKIGRRHLDIRREVVRKEISKVK